MINRQKQIREKGFEIVSRRNTPPEDYSQIKVGAQKLDDAVIDLDILGKSKNKSPLMDKDRILQAIEKGDIPALRAISNHFFRTSGIYSRLCRYMASLYRYDWYVTPKVVSNNITPEKVLKGFSDTLDYLDNFNAKQFFNEVALKVITEGAYYGYIIDYGDSAAVQELPAAYCRSRYKVNLNPAVEFNMKFFDDYYNDVEQRMKVLNLFPAEFKKGYSLYKQGKLKPDFNGDQPCWYLLDIESTVKFDNQGEEIPMFIGTIPAIIDLNDAQELDRKKMAQQLLKIIVQKMPLDKNGELVFDVDEARQLHNNAVQMLGRAIGIDVLTTFADVQVENMADNRSTTTKDELQKVERAIFNEAGVASSMFNPEGNLSLEKAILNDESCLYNMLLQFQAFLNRIASNATSNTKKVVYTVQILNTTIYNYKDLSEAYKGLVSLGLASRLLPAIALGQSQSSILASAHFEMDILKLDDLLVPPMSSNTRSGSQAKVGGDTKSKGGRPEKPDDEKSDKTIANRESMS